MKPRMSLAERSQAALAAVVTLMMLSPRAVLADGAFAQATAFLELDVRPPRIEGVLWLDRGTMESRFPIDRDGDMQYTDGEVYSVRAPVNGYVARHLRIMWDGTIAPLQLKNLSTERRRRSLNDCLKYTFSVSGYDAGEPLIVSSDLLRDIWGGAPTLLAVQRDGRSVVCVLDSRNYYDSRVVDRRVRSASSRPVASGAGPRAASQPADYACSKLCLGVALTDAKATCPRCGAPAALRFGGPVPGVGVIGPHGGELLPFVPREYRVEGLLTVHRELRVYLTNERLERLPIGKLSGTVQFWSPLAPKMITEKDTLKLAADGSYLYAVVPDAVVLPMKARCLLDLHDGLGNRMAEFEMTTMINLE